MSHETEHNDVERLLPKTEALSINHRTGTPDVQKHCGVYITQLILRILSLLTSLCIIAVLVLSVRNYTRTKNVTNPFHDGRGSFPIWPENLKLWPSFILLGAAVFAATFSFVLILASCAKSVSVNVRGKNGPLLTCCVGMEYDDNRKCAHHNHLLG